MDGDRWHRRPGWALVFLKRITILCQPDVEIAIVFNIALRS